jgi:tRNA(fMet)-specific endonuclease VapC
VSRYLLDAHHLNDTMQAVSVVRDRLWQLRRQGNSFRIISPVLCQTVAGVIRLSDALIRRRRLREVLRVVRTWPIETAIAERYGIVYRELRDAGKVLSQVDMMIAATARYRNAVVLTSDPDFENLPDITTENWLDP